MTEGGRAFEEETLVSDLSLQGAMIALKHSPRLQSELQVMMQTPGANGLQAMRLRGYVVRIDAGTEKGQQVRRRCLHGLGQSVNRTFWLRRTHVGAGAGMNLCRSDLAIRLSEFLRRSSTLRSR